MDVVSFFRESKFEPEDWASILPKMKGIHRGMAVELPEDVHNVVHDSNQYSPERRAKALVDHIHQQYGGLGTHWSDEKTAHKFAQGNHQPGRTKVVLHAHTPHPDHVETDPDQLNEGAVYRHDDWTTGEKEVPLKRGAPAQVHSVTWYGPRNKKTKAELHSADRGRHTAGRVEPAMEDVTSFFQREAVSAMLDLYHRTSPESAEAIHREKRMTSKERGPGGRGTPAFFSTHLDGQATGYGEGVVHVRVPEHIAELDDEFPDGEQHYTVDTSKLRPHHFVAPQKTAAADEVSYSYKTYAPGVHLDDKSTWGDHHAKSPHGAAVAYAQEKVVGRHPNYTIPHGSAKDSEQTLRHVLRTVGHPQADDAFVIHHPEPDRNQSVAYHSEGDPGMAMHPDAHAPSLVVAHEAAHLMHMHELGRRPKDDAEAHGPDFMRHYRDTLGSLDRTGKSVATLTEHYQQAHQAMIGGDIPQFEETEHTRPRPSSWPKKTAAHDDWDESKPLFFSDPDDVGSLHSGDERGGHRPAAHGAPLHDLTNGGHGGLPDAYDDLHHYTHGRGRNPDDHEAADAARQARGKPDREVSIFRAIPRGGRHEVNPGDWVSTSKSYAQAHAAMRAPDEDDPSTHGPVLEARVPAKHVINGGGDIMEWGYGGHSPARVTHVHHADGRTERVGDKTAALHDSQDPSTWSDHYRDVARARPYGTAINQVHEHLHREAPRHSAPLPDDYQEANGTLHRMLGEMGHPHASKAVLQPHLDPESRSSHSETPEGVPTVALAPQHWTYGHLAHEAAHLMDRHGRDEEWSDPDQDSHGPDFAHHFSNALRTVHPTKAGADDVEPEYHAALDRIQDATGAQLSHERLGKTAFYHGTAVEGVDQILPAGQYAYATTDQEAARLHARTAAEASGKPPVVYMVEALGAVEQHGAEAWSQDGWRVVGDI